MKKANGNHISKYNLCTGCGLCSVINNSTRMIEKQGLIRPESYPQPNVLNTICPGIGYDLKQMGVDLFPGTKYKYELGNYQELLALRSQSSITLKNASSGGVITEICKYALEQHIADGVICTKYDYNGNAVRPVTYIAYNEEELMQSQGSKYCPTSTLSKLSEVEKNPDKKYVLIGTPCQIAGFRKYSQLHTTLKKQVILCISNFCGGYRDFRELDFFIHEIAGFKKATFFRHRGGGQPGGMKIISDTGEEFCAPYPDYAKLSRYVKVERCTLCMDAVAELADISCGDAWLEDLKEDGPWSIAITRSQSAQTIVESMISNNRLCVKRNLTEEEVILSQKSNLTSKKYRQYYRMKIRSLLFKASPDFHDSFPVKQGSLLSELKVFISKERAKKMWQRMTKIALLFFILFIASSPASLKGADYDAFMRLTQGKTVITVSKEYDLGGRTVFLKKGSKISVEKKGRILNGTIVGDESIIVKSKHGLGVFLQGSWNQKKIQDSFFDWEVLDDNAIINNIDVLQADNIHNNIILTKEKYCLQIEKENGYCIAPSSNCCLVIDSRIELKPNHHRSYSIINIRRKVNVVLSGAGAIVGDVGIHEYVSGSSSEWGMGIKIDESSNVKISNLTITKCTGDGIYITGGNESAIGRYDYASRLINIEGITCDDNRRQGISVIHVDGLNVKKCRLINTGKTEFTKPASGIDIEPNVSNGRNMSVRNVIITDCVAMNNGQYDYVTSGCAFENEIYNFENVVFDKCTSTGVSYFTSPVVLKNSEIGSLKLLGYDLPIDVMVEKTTIYDGIDFHCPKTFVQLSGGKKLINSLCLNNCQLSVTSNDNSRNLFRRMAGNMDNVGLIRVVGSTITTIDDNRNTVQIKDRQLPPLLVEYSVINMPGVIVDPQNNRYKDVTFKCLSVPGYDASNEALFNSCNIEVTGENKQMGLFERLVHFFQRQ